MYRKRMDIDCVPVDAVIEEFKVPAYFKGNVRLLMHLQALHDDCLGGTVGNLRDETGRIADTHNLNTNVLYHADTRTLGGAQ
jgi:hypothetical protein